MDTFFDGATAIYNTYSQIQSHVVLQLAEMIPSFASGDRVLELGAGTGHLTRHLAAKCNDDVDLVVTDLSHNMIVTCRAGFNRLAKPPLFAQMDAAKIGLEGKFNCIAHSMMIHWLDDMTGALENQRQMLTEKGQLFYATIGICHFNEWQHHLQQHRLDTPLRKDIPVNWPGCVKEEFIERDYGSGRNFLKMMSKTGANAPKPDYRKPSPKALKNACDTFDGKVTWHVVYGVLGG